MKSLNLTNKTKSDIKYSFTKFPDGELQINLKEYLNRKESIKVICRITSADELFLLTQVGDILDRHEIEWNLYITYLMSMRMDRVMNFNRPFSLKIVCNILNNMNYQEIYILEPHSNRVMNLLKSPNYWCFDSIEDAGEEGTLVFPDKGAYDRYSHLTRGRIDYLVFDKIRDIKTGKITQFNIAESTEDMNTDKFTFIDDLCDAGGTFLGELKILKEIYPHSTYEIIICHAVNSLGIKNLCENFDNVIISNSYRDIKSKPFENLTIIDVCNNDY